MSKGRKPNKRLVPHPVVCGCGKLAFVSLTGPWLTITDVDDLPLLRGGTWGASNSGAAATIYAQRTEAHKRIFLHRAIVGAPSGLDVDHRDNNGLNNSRQNLRVATRIQNSRNSRPRMSCSSKYKGVYWSRVAGKWAAYINFEKERYHLGLFVDEDSAAAAYNEAAIKMFGEFACVNDV